MGTVIHVEERRAGWPVMPIVAAVFAAGGLIVSWLHLDRLPVTLCMFKSVTGLPCMSCGTTRALGRLGAFDPLGALAMNPLATLAVAALFAYALVDLLFWTRGRRLKLGLSRGQKLWILGLGFLAVFVNWAYLIWAGR
jgi:uncharacterized protein DUF2752